MMNEDCKVQSAECGKQKSIRIPHSAFRTLHSSFIIHHSSFIIIFLLAGLLRFAGLGNCPPGLFRDEAEKGYNAWALATTGGALEFSGGAGPGPAIQWRRLPWMINVMGGKTSAIYQYAAAPFVRLGGLSVGATRAASALIGTLTAGLLGLLLMRVWGRWEGLAAALWLALSPWHLVFSRWALEGIFVPFFIVLILIGLRGVERRRRWGWPLAGAAMGWLFYSYSGAQPLVPAWGLCLLVLYRRRLRLRDPYLWLGLALFLIPVIPTVLVRLAPGGSTRLERIAIWSEPGLSGWGVARRFIANYFAHFNPRFLFLSGDTLARHSIPGLGQLTVVDALLLPVGLVASLRRRRWRMTACALLALFLCAPLPAAITRVGIPHALRAFGMAVPAAVWGGLGLVVIGRWLARRLAARGIPAGRRRFFIGAFAAACVLAALNSFSVYWRLGHGAPVMQVAFEAGERRAWETLLRERQPGERVFVNGTIPYAPYYQLFFLRPEPRAVVAQGLEASGVIYFDPAVMNREVLDRAMQPGDWLVTPIDPATPPAEGGPGLDRAQMRRAGEAWVELVRKP